jgi:hypothetical protein
MDTQEEGALQREQDIEALIRRLPGFRLKDAHAHI